MTVDTETASPSPEGGAVVCARPTCDRPAPVGPSGLCVPCSADLAAAPVLANERHRARRRRRHAADIEAATEALHEAAIYFEAGHYLTFTGSQVAAILADRITALDEAYLADISQTRTTPCPK